MVIYCQRKINRRLGYGMSKKKFVTKWSVIVCHDNGTENVYRHECDGVPTYERLSRCMDRYDRRDVRSLRVVNELGKTVMMRYGKSYDVFGIHRKED